MEGDGRLQKTGGLSGCRPPKDEAPYSVKRTVHSSEQKSFPLGIKFHTCNAVTWFIEAKCVAGKVKPPEEHDLTLPH